MLTLINLSGLGLAAVAAPALWRQPAIGGRYLAGLLVSVAAQMGANSLLASGAITSWPHLTQLHVPFAFAIGPLIYLYAARLAQRDISWRLHLAHFAPSIIAVLWLAPFYLQSADDKLVFLAGALERYPAEWRLRQAALVTQMGGYVIAAVLLRSKALAATPQAARWSGPLLVAAPAIWTLTLARFVLAYESQTATWSTAAVACAIGFVVSANLFPPAPSARRPPARVPAVDDPDASACFERVKALLSEREQFRDPQLTLESLAAAVSTTPHFLSQVINERAGRSVPDFVNGYRIAAVTRALASDAHMPAWHVAQAAGFNSRSAFHAAFRRHVGVTPSEFRRQSRTES